MLDWRGSSGSLWGRGSKGEPDIVNGTRDEGRPPDSGKSNYGKSRRKGLRKRFLSLTEGLATLLTTKNEKKEFRERSVSVSRGSIRENKFENSDLNSGYSSDVEHRSECRRTNSIGSVSSFKPSLPRNNSKLISSSSSFNINDKKGKEWKSPLLERRCTDSILKTRPGKAPPSPPPRRYSLWALPDTEEYTEPLKPPLSAHLTAFITSPPQLKPPPPPPPIRFCNQVSPPLSPPRSPRILSSSSYTKLKRSPSPKPVVPKRPDSPVLRELDNILYGTYTPPSSPLITNPYESINASPRYSRASSESIDQRGDWYRRKALSRKSPFSCKYSSNEDLNKMLDYYYVLFHSIKKKY